MGLRWTIQDALTLSGVEAKVREYEKLIKKITKCIQYLDTYWYNFTHIESMEELLGSNESPQGCLGEVFSGFTTKVQEHQEDFLSVKNKMDRAYEDLVSMKQQAAQKLVYYEGKVMEENRRKRNLKANEY